jgi:hypothetical protein
LQCSGELRDIMALAAQSGCVEARRNPLTLLNPLSLQHLSDGKKSQRMKVCTSTLRQFDGRSEDCDTRRYLRSGRRSTG